MINYSKISDTDFWWYPKVKISILIIKVRIFYEIQFINRFSVLKGLLVKSNAYLSLIWVTIHRIKSAVFVSDLITDKISSWHCKAKHQSALPIKTNDRTQKTAALLHRDRRGPRSRDAIIAWPYIHFNSPRAYIECILTLSWNCFQTIFLKLFVN